jgi:hypothetical protein
MAEKERRMRERERIAAEQKEAEINRLKSDHSKWLGEKDTESKRLRDKLQEEERKARELQQRVEEMKLQTAHLERQKQEENLKLMEQSLQKAKANDEETARLKQELEKVKRESAEMKTQKSQLESQVISEAKKKAEADELKRQVEEMKRAIAQKEQERVRMELRVQQEQASREQAELAAQQAANAAEVAARAAIEASRHQPAPVQNEEIGRKRPLAKSGSDDVEMEDVSHSRPHARVRAAGECCASLESRDLMFVLICACVWALLSSSEAVAGGQEAPRAQQGESSSCSRRQTENVVGRGAQGRAGRGGEAHPGARQVALSVEEEETGMNGVHTDQPTTLNTEQFLQQQITLTSAKGRRYHFSRIFFEPS